MILGGDDWSRFQIISAMIPFLPGETEAPAGTVKALGKAERMQDLLLERMKPGRSGNKVLAETLAQVMDEGIRGTVYSHPIGDHGHGAEPITYRVVGPAAGCTIPGQRRGMSRYEGDVVFDGAFGGSQRILHVTCNK